MRLHFEMRADLHFSAEFSEEAKSAFSKMISESGPVFQKGVPKEASIDEVGRVEGAPLFSSSRVTLVFASGPYTRVHDALFRLRKQIAPAMGKFRMGLREIEVRDYRITIRADFPAEFHIPNLPFIDRENSRLEGDTLVLALHVDAADLENRIPDRLVRLIEEKIQAATYGGKGEHWELVFESPKRKSG